MAAPIRRTLLLSGALAALVAVASQDWPVASPLALAGAIGLAVVASFWLLRLAWRRLLFRVGRRLAFSYFLLGVLPIPMLALLAAVGVHFLAGFFLGHLYRDAATAVRAELTMAAGEAATAFARGEGPGPGPSGIALAWYRDNRRVAGDLRAPGRWPEWLAVAADPSGASGPPGASSHSGAGFVSLPDGSLAFAAARRSGRVGVVALRADDLAETLGERTGAVVRLHRADDPERRGVTFLEIGGRRLALRQLRLGVHRADAAEFLRRYPPAAGGKGSVQERPLVQWVELAGPPRDLASGTEAAEFVSASLVSSAGALRERLHSGSAEVDTTAWLLFLSLSAVLLDIYVVAAALALFMIFGLSRAVNHLSRATAAIGAGDFGTRIRVRRTDQLGALQRSFNEMAAHLQELVATAAQKEALDKELALARTLQQDLLPRQTQIHPAVLVSTHFEPSAAIGGDYFDILRAGDATLAVVIADVAGHGLPAGLRMAMLKAALRILVEDGADPRATMRRLGELVHSERRGRTFVTATLGLLEVGSGTLRLINAGHPPCYVVRPGGVEEILLPSPPLGTLDQRFAEREVSLEPGETVVFLSDGLIEARDGEGEPFGYDRARQALAGAAGSPESVRDRLLAAVAAHAGAAPAEDDRTLVVLAYRGEPAGTPKSS